MMVLEQEVGFPLSIYRQLCTDAREHDGGQYGSYILVEQNKAVNE